jgi:phage-related protein
MEREPKPVRWVGSSRRDLRAFPAPARRNTGQAFYAAQRGEEYPSVKALQGFGGRSVLEIVAPYAGDAYRAVYHGALRGRDLRASCFPEEVKEGHIDTQKGNRLIKQRLVAAEQDYRERHN